MSNDADAILLTEYSGGVARLKINRPNRLNTLSRDLMRRLRRELFELSDNRDVRIIHLSAAGEEAFCAGADMKEPGAHEFEDLSAYMREQPAVFDMMLRCRQIIVSEVNGWAVGGGMQLALFSDLIYTSETAAFKLPQVSLGLIPPYGVSGRLAKCIGQGRAMEMSLLGRTMSAREAYDWGFTHGLAPDATSLRDEVEQVIETLLALPPEGLLLAKESMLSGWDMSAEGAVLADRFRSYALRQSSSVKSIHKQWRDSHSPATTAN